MVKASVRLQWFHPGRWAKTPKRVKSCCHRYKLEVSFVDQGYTVLTVPFTKEAAKQHGIDLVVIRLDEAKRGFVLVPKRWVHSE